MDNIFMFSLRDKPKQVERNRKAFGIPLLNHVSKDSDSSGILQKVFELRWWVGRRGK